jgi:hypothetical protein
MNVRRRLEGAALTYESQSFVKTAIGGLERTVGKGMGR